MNAEKMMTLEQALEALKEIQEKKNDCGGDIFVGHTDNGTPNQHAYHKEVMSGSKFDAVVKALETAIRLRPADPE